MVGFFDFGSGMPLPPPLLRGGAQANTSRPLAVPQGFGSQAVEKRTHGGKESGSKTQKPTAPRFQETFLGTRRVLETKDLAHKFKPRNEDGTTFVLSRMPSFVRRADQELLNYLFKRDISEGFLHEIDRFLADHPELLVSCPAWCRQLATLSPLKAYLFFVRGYLRPAKYRDGALPPPEQLRIPIQPISLQSTAFDTELLDFFNDCGECFKILAEMDSDVVELTSAFHTGRWLGTSQLKLLALVVYGQPVDALKYYEYCYQTNYLPHRYLGVHNVLSHLGAPQRESDEYEEPQPCMINLKSSWYWVRKAMAMARDRNMDVIPILIDCFADYLERSHNPPRANEIVRLRQAAHMKIECERNSPTGADIVDVVMEYARGVLHGCNKKTRNRHTMPNHSSQKNRPSQVKKSSKSSKKKKPTQQQPNLGFKIQSKAITRTTKKIRALYEREAREGSIPELMRLQKKEEYHLAYLVGNFGRQRGLMNDADYQFLREVFPERKISRQEDYDEVNPNRYDVLVFLKKWL